MKNKPLSILHLFNAYLPQTENWAYNLISTLPNCKIHIGANNYLKNNFYHPRFHFIDNHYDEFNKMNQRLDKRRLSNILKKITIKSLPFIFGNIDDIFVDYGKKEKIQMIHAHFANVGWEFKNIAKQLDVPFCVSFYGWDYEKLPFTQPKYKKRLKQLFKLADGFICEGSHGAAILEKSGCPPKKIFIVKLGVQPNTIPVIQRKKSSGQLKLVQVASFTEKKGHYYAIEAVSRIIKKCPNIELTFIGNDNELLRREKLEQQVSKLNLDNKIRFLPAIDYHKLYQTLSSYDLFIHPSCYGADRDCEGGAPVVLLDAQATGMPVISTTHCDIPDEVIHKKTGLLSPEKDIATLANNLETFYNMDDETYQVFAQNARVHVEENYNINTNTLKLKEVYDKILSSQ